MSKVSDSMNSPKVGGYLNDADGQMQLINVMGSLIYFGLMKPSDANAIAWTEPSSGKRVVLAIDIETSIMVIMDPSAVGESEENIEDGDLFTLDLNLLTNKAKN